MRQRPHHRVRRDHRPRADLRRAPITAKGSTVAVGSTVAPASTLARASTPASVAVRDGRAREAGPARGTARRNQQVAALDLATSTDQQGAGPSALAASAYLALVRNDSWSGRAAQGRDAVHRPLGVSADLASDPAASSASRRAWVTSPPWRRAAG